ncbi:MAG: tRNA-dihydrouridine synthase family protein [Bdellovibrionales bacterium]|nr:tRNA-dihydrouridine synthase family protein [Bdellovibrionales bacterium]
MVGLSHVCLRDVVREYMPKGAKTIWPSEMLSTRRLPYEDLTQVAEGMNSAGDDFWAPQILGNEEKFIAASIQKLEDHGAHAIDINMGCPVQKALRHNYGVALMGDVDYAAKVVEMTVRNTKLPVSVKLRAGFESDPQKLLNFTRALENAGAAWITLHPRTVEQKRKGEADWSQIAFLRKELKIPVIGNGDVQTAEDAISLLEKTDCHMAMVGRALVARPWLMWQYGEKMGFENPEGKEGRAPRTPQEEAREYFICARKMMVQMQEKFKPTVAFRKYIFYIKTSSVWMDYGHYIWSRMTKCKQWDDIAIALDELEGQAFLMHERTELRI